MFVIYNANGREIGSYDSQPTKFAARELLLRGTLGLNYVVGFTPELAKRSAFARRRDGRYRSAYSPVPAVIAAAITWPLWQTGLVDMRAPRAPSLISALSQLAAACRWLSALAFLTARTRLSRRRARWRSPSASASARDCGARRARRSGSTRPRSSACRSPCAAALPMTMPITSARGAQRPASASGWGSRPGAGSS